MNVVTTDLAGVVIIEPKVHEDERGFFLETFQRERYQQQAGIDLDFVQDNHSHSRCGVLRGLHAQRRAQQGKLVRVVRGEVFDVVADIDPRSKTYGRWVGVTLSEDDHRQLWVPPGYAHGFLTLSASADFEYKCTDYYDADDEIGVVWNDPDLGIAWPIDDPIVSPKDAALPRLADVDNAT